MGNDGKISDVLHQARASKGGLKTFDQKKGRVLERTRPEPTIFGNCESWKVIVGKKRKKHRRDKRAAPRGRKDKTEAITYPHAFIRVLGKTAHRQMDGH
jgi:hypothetical protein